MTRILSVFNLLKRVGFAVLLLGGAGTEIQAQVRWVAEFAPTSYLLCRAVALTPTEVVVVGGIRDDWMGTYMDGFIQTLNIQDGDAQSFYRRQLGLNTIFRDVVSLGNDQIGVCGQIHTFDSGYAGGFVATISQQGTVLWSRTAPLPEVRDATAIMLAPDSTLIAASPWQDVVHALGTQIYFTRHDTSGTLIDSLRTPYVYGERIHISDIACFAPEQYIFVGEIYRVRDPIIPASLYIHVTDSAFGLLWSRTVTLQDTLFNATSVSVSAAGDIYVGGIANDWPTEVRILKYSSDGEFLWHRSYIHGTPGPIEVRIECIGDKILVGSTYYDGSIMSPYVSVINSSGDMVWDSVMTIESSSSTPIIDMAVSEDERTAVLVANGGPDELPHDVHGYVICLDLDEILSEEASICPAIPRNAEITNVFPNPTNSSVMIAFRIHIGGNVSAYLTNILGQKVLSLFERSYSPGEYQLNVSLGEVASGQYAIVLESESGRITKSVMLVR